MATKATVREVDQIIGFQLKTGASLPSANRFGVRVKILPGERLDAFRADDRGWSSMTMDDGQVLAVCLVEDHFDEETRLDKLPDPLNAFGVDEAEDPEWAADARDLRSKLMAFLESLPKTDWLELRVGGNGTGSLTINYGEAGLILGIGRDPAAC